MVISFSLLLLLTSLSLDLCSELNSFQPDPVASAASQQLFNSKHFGIRVQIFYPETNSIFLQDYDRNGQFYFQAGDSGSYKVWLYNDHNHSYLSHLTTFSTRFASPPILRLGLILWFSNSLFASILEVTLLTMTESLRRSI